MPVRSPRRRVRRARQCDPPLLLGAATFAVWLTFRILAARQTTGIGTFVVRATRSLAWLVVGSEWVYWAVWPIRDVPVDVPAAQKLVLLVLAFASLGASASGWLLRRCRDRAASTR